MSKPINGFDAVVSGSLQANKELAFKFLDLAFSNSMDAALELLEVDATWWVGGDPEQLPMAGEKTRAQAEILARNLHKVLPDGMSFRVLGITAEGERVAVEVEAEGNWKNEKRYFNCYHFLFQIRNAKIIAIREHLDTLRLFDVL